MKKTLISACLITGLFLLTNHVQAQNKPAPKPKAPVTKAAPPAAKPNESQVKTEMPTPEQMQTAMMDYATVGKEQEFLTTLQGTWSVKTVFWMYEGAEPASFAASCMFSTMYENKYLTGSMHGDFNGRPFEGLNTMAFDNAIKKFQSTWIDNMGTGIMMTEGTSDPSFTSLKLNGEMVNPVTKKKEPVRQIISIPNRNEMKMEMYVTRANHEFKCMEVSYNR